MLEGMAFEPSIYGTAVAAIFALAGDGVALQELRPRGCTYPEAKAALAKLQAGALFPGARSPHGALSGLYLYLGCLDEAHAIAQDLASREGSYWHGVMHRMEGDFGNAKYWFERAGAHPVFPEIVESAREIGYDAGDEWDPFEFTDFCETSGRRSGSEEEAVAKGVQLIEWRFLFDWCAGSGLQR